MRRAIALWLAGAAALLAAAPLQAEPPGPPPAAPAPAAPSGTLRLSLHDAVRLAIDNNLDVELLRYDPLVAEQDLAGAWGAYDPEAFGEGGYSNVETPVATNLLRQTVLKERTWAAETGLRGLFPWLGGAYSLSYAGSELESNSSLTQLSPSFGTNFLASVQVPVLRDLFWSEPWTAVRLTRIGVDASRERFETELMDVVQRTEDAYWGLIAARDNTHTAEKSLETARALLEQTQAQYEVGVVSRVEVVQAEAGVADREFRRIAADAIERNAQDALVDVVLGPYLAPRSEVMVEPLDSPADVPVREVDPEAATERAFSQRPEIDLARREIERRKVELRFASNQRLPQLDVVASYGNTGLAGTRPHACTTFLGAPCPTPTVGRNWMDADNDFFTDDAAENFSVGGVLSFPIGNVRARSDHERARLELHRAETALRRLEQSIVSDIRRAARNLLSALEGIEAAERAVAAAEEQLRAERVRLEYGESTPFDVLLREEDLVRAESQKILAQQTYHNAITQLDRAQGTILERNQIVVEEAAALR
jgi:outer membrane protein TolC